MENIDRDLNQSEVSPPIGDTMQRPEHYPTIHFEGPEELGLPEHGTMLVHYKVLKETETKSGDREWYSCDIAIKRIISAEAEKDMRPSKRDTSAEDNLDRLMREHESDEEKGDDGY